MPNPNKDPERLDRHSGTGRRGLPKKEGYGKYGWGDIMDEAEMIQKGEIPDQDEFDEEDEVEETNTSETNA